MGGATIHSAGGLVGEGRTGWRAAAHSRGSPKPGVAALHPPGGPPPLGRSQPAEPTISSSKQMGSEADGRLCGKAIAGGPAGSVCKGNTTCGRHRRHGPSAGSSDGTARRRTTEPCSVAPPAGSAQSGAPRTARPRSRLGTAQQQGRARDSPARRVALRSGHHLNFKTSVTAEAMLGGPSAPSRWHGLRMRRRRRSNLRLGAAQRPSSLPGLFSATRRLNRILRPPSTPRRPPLPDENRFAPPKVHAPRSRIMGRLRYCALLALLVSG